jgi:hypothetical protein
MRRLEVESNFLMDLWITLGKEERLVVVGVTAVAKSQDLEVNTEERRTVVSPVASFVC